MSDSNAASSSQTLLDALIELRRLGPAGVFSDSGRFRAFMLDLRPGMKKEVRVLSALIDAGYLQRLQDAAESEREIVSAQIRLWLDEELDLKSETAHNYSSVLLAFFSGAASMAAACFLPAQSGAGVPSGTSQPSAASNLSVSPKSAGVCRKLLHYEIMADKCKGCTLCARLCSTGAINGKNNTAHVIDQSKCVKCGVCMDNCRFNAIRSVSEAASPKPVVSPLRDIYANKRVGERFEFGRYPQGKNGEVMPVTWRVLRRDSDSLLVIAEKGLDCKPYHGTDTHINWANCTLRRWLNGEFYNRAFNEEERSLVLSVSVSNNAGPSTDDRVFLLSVDEANSLFANDYDRQAASTDFAIKNGVYTNDEYMIGDDASCWWWLRSRGWNDCRAALVNYVGGVYGRGVAVDDGLSAVRPAFKIAL